VHSDDEDLFSARTRRRLVRSRYAPIEQAGDDVAQLRTDVLARLLVERLSSLGPITEAEAVDAVGIRAPGRGRATVDYALHVGLVRRIAGEDDQADALAAVGRPSRTLAA
jgi:hypothetical protein